MKINWKTTILAGILGTIVFDLVGLILTGKFFGLPTLLGSKLGVGVLGGVAAHYGNGVIIAVIYAAISPSLWGSRVSRALTFVTIQTVFGVWFFMLPLLGAGIAGTKMGAMVPVITLARHLAFGLVLAALVRIPKCSDVNETLIPTTV